MKKNNDIIIMLESDPEKLKAYMKEAVEEINKDIQAEKRSLWEVLLGINP